ncbi:MAG TPA: hypothetical protein VGK46_03015 [Saprospiraceae bacterium]
MRDLRDDQAKEPDEKHSPTDTILDRLEKMWDRQILKGDDYDDYDFDSTKSGHKELDDRKGQVRKRRRKSV